MGPKDQIWREAPGYCVECENLRPLNKSGVCRRCHDEGPDWESLWTEDYRCSRYFYERYFSDDPINRRKRRLARAGQYLVIIQFKDSREFGGIARTFDIIGATDETHALELWRKYLQEEGVDNPEEAFAEELHIMKLNSQGFIFRLDEDGVLRAISLG